METDDQHIRYIIQLNKNGLLKVYRNPNIKPAYSFPDYGRYMEICFILKPRDQNSFSHLILLLLRQKAVCWLFLWDNQPSSLSRKNLSELLRMVSSYMCATSHKPFTFQEMLDIMKAIYDMMGKCTYPVLKEDAPRQHVETFFQVGMKTEVKRE